MLNRNQVKYIYIALFII